MAAGAEAAERDMEREREIAPFFFRWEGYRFENESERPPRAFSQILILLFYCEIHLHVYFLKLRGDDEAE